MYKNQNGVIKKLKLKQTKNHECIKSLMATILWEKNVSPFLMEWSELDG